MTTAIQTFQNTLSIHNTHNDNNNLARALKCTKKLALNPCAQGANYDFVAT